MAILVENKTQRNILPVSTWYSEPLKSVFEKLGVSDAGLLSTEAFIRLKKIGPNSLPEPEKVGLVKLFLRQFQSPLIYILFVASAVVFFLGDITDALVILGVLFINAAIGVFQEGRAHNTLSALRNFTKTEAVVFRDGVETIIPDSEVVPGDIIFLREGDKVPADARVLEARTLSIDESALTGESLPTKKTNDVLNQNTLTLGDQKNMVFKGTFITSGFGKAVVVSTGLTTIIGSISKQIVSLNTEIPLKKDIQKLSKLVAVGVLLISILVFVVGFIKGYSASEMFFTSVAVAVSLIPEGLPIVITLILASGAYRMAKKNALVKNLNAVEALGQATVIAVDKTGTITKNELMVETVWVAGNKFTVGGSGYEPTGPISFDQNKKDDTAGENTDILVNNLDSTIYPELKILGKIATLCASARVSFNEEEKQWHVSGDPTEAALLVFGQKVGFNKDKLEIAEPQINELPFDSKLKYHLSIHKINGKQFMTIVGAPEAIMMLCSNQWFVSRNLALTAKRRDEIEKVVHSMSRKGDRVLAAAIIPAFRGELGINEVGKATFVGLFGMRDTLRAGVREAVEAARSRGLRVVMITGDHKITAEAIAREAGIFKDGDAVLSDKEIRDLNETELLTHLKKTSVFARISPDEKLLLINLYRKNGEIIAMTGDGVNDALSLVAADLGVAMGKIGTEVSKEAADIVLLDDNFKSIVSAIDEGRNMYRGIKKVILYLFSTGFGELFTVLFALILSFPLILFPTQILWLNLVTDGFMIFALGLEEGDSENNTALHRRHSFFDKLAIFRMFLMSAVMTVGGIFVFSLFYETDLIKASTMAFTVLAVSQWFNAWNVRSKTESVLSSRFFTNPYLIIFTTITIVLQLLAIYTPFLNKILHTAPLSLYELFIVIVISSSIIWVEEIRKLFHRRMLSNKQTKTQWINPPKIQKQA